jgi:outer membrane protein assembly factor BamE (lipoprotein component of BamABCDE complex)
MARTSRLGKGAIGGGKNPKLVSKDCRSVLRRHHLLALLCLVGLLCACGYAKGRRYALEGRLFPGRLVSSLEKGMSAEEVKEILGEPLEKTYLDESSQERWRYDALHRQDEEVIFLGRPIRRVPYYIVESEVILLFRNGLLNDIESRERAVKPRAREIAPSGSVGSEPRSQRQLAPRFRAEKRQGASLGRPGVGGGMCKPSFMKVSEQPFVAEIGAWQYGYNVVLVGCASGLRKIAEDEKRSISRYFDLHVVREPELNLHAIETDAQVRAKILSDLGKIDKDNLIHNFYFDLRWSAESM